MKKILTPYKSRIGEKFGRLTITEYLGKGMFACVCECGNKKTIKADHIISGRVKSCGCLATEMLAKRNKGNHYSETHGESKTRLYQIWSDIKQRCYNPKQFCYKWYGGKGIGVCDEWKNDYTSFKKWAINNGYAENLTIDRINPKGDYCPNNCRFVTMSEQARNKSSNIIVEIGGEKKCLLDWCEKLGKNYRTIMTRVRNGWLIKPALFCKEQTRKGSEEYEKFARIN